MTIKQTRCLVKPALFILPVLLAGTVARADYLPANDISYQQVSLQQFTGWQYTDHLPPDIQPYSETGSYQRQLPPAAPNRMAIPWQQTVNQLPQQAWQPAAIPQGKSQLSPARKAVIDTAFQQMGIRYRWGGNTPRQGFDCSGFTKFAHKKLNLSIPRTAAEQSAASRTISRRDLRPGDMIFFKTSGRTVNHVGIYLGNGKFIHAASGGGKVTTDDLRKEYWQQRLHKYGTFLG